MILIFCAYLLFRYLFLSKYLNPRKLLAFDAATEAAIAGALIGSGSYVIGGCAAFLSILYFLTFVKMQGQSNGSVRTK